MASTSSGVWGTSVKEANLSGRLGATTPMSQEVFCLLKSKISSPLNLIDVGAAGGALEGWRRFGDKARIFCFEAREDEASDLAGINTESNIEYVPVALSADNRGIALTVTSNLGCSSVYPPIKQLYQRYPGCAMMRPISHANCPSITLDEFIEQRGIEIVHAIKLDTQGSELDILKGAEKALKGCIFLIVEVEFNALYEGQPLFCDVDSFLRDRGFVLWRFNNLAHNSAGHISGGPHSMLIGSDPGGHHTLVFPNGQLFWADALYVKEAATPINDKRMPSSEAVAGAALVVQWKLWDLAVEMIRKSGDKALVLETLTLLDSSFVESSRDRYSAEEFRSQVLTPQSFCYETDFSAPDGCIVYGPYVRLPWGEQEVTFHVRASGLDDQELSSVIMFDIAQDITRVASVELVGANGAEVLRNGEVKLRFFNSAPRALFEFRIYTSGRPFNGKLAFYGASVRQVSQ
jgi:FkbM family methyltransferase